MTKQNESEALVKIESYVALAPETRDAAMDAMRANLGEMDVTPLSLNRITVPSGGSPFFTVKSVDNPSGDPVKELKGILIYQRDTRAYWKVGMDEGGGGSPPDCASDNGKVGVGDPGGVCALCPLSKFVDGERPECKQMRLMFLLREGMYLPDVIQVPPSSLKHAASYMLGLASQGLPYFAVQTVVGLEKAQSRDGIDYAKLTFRPFGRVPSETLSEVVEYAKMLRGVFDSVAPVEVPQEA